MYISDQNQGNVILQKKMNITGRNTQNATAKISMANTFLQPDCSKRLGRPRTTWRDQFQPRAGLSGLIIVSKEEEDNLIILHNALIRPKLDYTSAVRYYLTLIDSNKVEICKENISVCLMILFLSFDFLIDYFVNLNSLNFRTLFPR